MFVRRHSRHVSRFVVGLASLLLVACGPKPDAQPQPQTPPVLTPTAPDALSMATNLVRGYLRVGRDSYEKPKNKA